MTPAETISRRDFVRGAATAAAAAGVLATPMRAAAAKKPAGTSKLPDGPLYELSLAEAADLIRSRRLSPVDLAVATLDRIAEVEARVIAFVFPYSEAEVLTQARAAERLIRQGRYLGPLHGITVGVKDIYATKGKPTEANSALYAGYVPDFDAESVARLKAGGSVILGKTWTNETANGTPDRVPPSTNPWDPARTAGGSSTGSAAGQAAGEFIIGMGSCTGGSIRGPAANCGITGFKPTYGTISAHGVFSLSYTLDHIGPLLPTALDAALFTDALGGQDRKDPTTRPVKRYRLAKRLLEAPSRRPLRGVVVGIPSQGDYFRGVPNDEQLAAFDAAVAVIKGQGATIREVTADVLPPPLTRTTDMWDPICYSEVAAVRAQYLRDRPLDIGISNRQRIAAGLLMPGNGYVQAQRVRRAWVENLLTLWDEIDVLIHPADNIAALREGGGVPSARPSSGSKSNVWNLTGSPAVAIPTGLSAVERMPLSMQCVALPGNDEEALLVAHAFQLATDFHKAVPPL